MHLQVTPGNLYRIFLLFLMKTHLPSNNPIWPFHEYTTPEIEVIPCTLEGVVCESPDPGESEDVEYEDWD